MTKPEPVTLHANGSLSPQFLLHFAEACFMYGPSRQLLVTGHAGFHLLCSACGQVPMKMKPYNKGQTPNQLWKVTWPCGTWIVRISEGIPPFTMQSFHFATDAHLGSLTCLPDHINGFSFKS